MAPRRLQAALLALLLITAGCLGTTATAQTDGPGDAVRTIDVSAQGTATAPPDLAVVNVAVDVSADTADEARSRAAADVERMRGALRAIGIPDDAVRTTAYHVGPEYDHRNGERELVGYRAVHAFEVESDVDRAGEVIDAAAENGATRVHGVQFTLTDESQSELRGEAITEAMTDARTDAETIASAAGVSLGSITHASTSNGGFPRPYAVTAEAADGGASTVVEPGPVTVTASVSVSYEIR